MQDQARLAAGRAFQHQALQQHGAKGGKALLAAKLAGDQQALGHGGALAQARHKHLGHAGAQGGHQRRKEQGGGIAQTVKKHEHKRHGLLLAGVLQEVEAPGRAG